jgi:hypothetical protein
MYSVKLKYTFEYEAYGRTTSMFVEDLYIVVADTQYHSIEKASKFVLEEKPNAKFMFVNAILLDTGRHGLMISGIIQ